MLPPLPLEKPGMLHRFIPVTTWLPRYEAGWLRGDLAAALTVWALLIPEALAYAQIAGLPVQYGLYAAPLALLAYALFGGSRCLMVGPTSTVAIVSASVVAPIAAGGGGQDRYIALTVTLALMVGVLLVAAGAARLGFAAKFLAKPVLDGFIIGLAFTIALGQAGKFFGVHASGETALQKAVSILRQAGDWHWLPLAMGCACIALLFFLERAAPHVPAAITAVAITTLVAYLLRLGQHGLSLVGTTPAGFPSWMLKGVALEDLYHLLPGAFAVALVAFAESIAVAKEEAVRSDYEVDADQEMIANGMANIGAGLFQGFAVNGSLSKSAACEKAGGMTQAVSVICAVLTLGTMLFLTGLFKYLPEATLAAVVINALWKYFRFSGLARLYRVRKPDFALSAAALLGVLFFGIVPGILIGVVLSLALLLQRASGPNSVVLAREPGGTNFADVLSNPAYETIPGLLIYRFDAPLVFPNAERFADDLRRLVAASPDVQRIVLDFEAISDMDTTAADQLVELIKGFEKSGISFAAARVHSPVRKFMMRDGLLDRLGEGNVYPRVLDAVIAFEKRPRAEKDQTA